MQAFCPDPPEGAYTPPLRQRKAGQCVLTLEARLLQWLGDGAPADVWLHGLFVHAAQGLVNESALYWDPLGARDGGASVADAGSNRLWMTDVTMQGGAEGVQVYASSFAAGALACTWGGFVYALSRASRRYSGAPAGTSLAARLHIKLVNAHLSVFRRVSKMQMGL